MTRDGTSRSIRRGVVALLAAWMAIFAVVAAVHNHGILGFSPKHATLDQWQQCVRVVLDGDDPLRMRQDDSVARELNGE